ncbi:MAG: MBL fold metallo-hydrolase [Acidimicrobiia bacterium]|nr:MBL fold metallo-hydrolase [Acidimicrobiia bacterium]
MRVVNGHRAVLLVMVVFAMVVSTVVSAQTDTTFIDVPESHQFYEDIEWAARREITQGCTPPTNLRFCPDAPVTRGQMAAFLVRALHLPPADDQGFVDANGVFVKDVNRLAAAHITRGCNPPTNDRFCPNWSVTRGQMASFLTRALDLPPSGDQGFIDVGGVHADDVNSLATAGITRGCNPPTNDRFCPDDPVSRAQMTAFLRRGLTRTEPPAAGAWEIRVLDVGQGDSILLSGTDFTILVDAGPTKAKTTMLTHLDNAGVEEIDLFILTHPDPDHIAKAAEVLDNIPVDTVWASGDTADTYHFRQTVAAIRRSGAFYIEPRAGDIDNIGSAKIEVINPVDLDGTNNNDGIVARVSSGGVSILLSADAQKEAEAEMLARDIDLTADILKIGHHAADTSSSPEYLDAITPSIGVYGVGENNPHGHPHQVVLDRLAERNVDVYGTEIFGTITITIKNGAIVDVSGEHDFLD